MLLTEADPRGQLAEGGGVRVVTVGAEILKTNIDERLQHGHSCFCAWFGPLRLADCSIDVQGGQGFVPVYRLRGGQRSRFSQDSHTLQVLLTVKNSER